LNDNVSGDDLIETYMTYQDGRLLREVIIGYLHRGS
jgi:hypothetical protein